MKRLRRLTALSPVEQRLLGAAVVLLWTCRLGLRLVAFPKLERLLARLSEARVAQRGDPRDLDLVKTAIERAALGAPGAKCLARALAAQALLVWRGHPAELRLGVCRNAEGRLEAHAWVQSGGRVVVGDSTHLPRLAVLGEAGSRSSRLTFSTGE
jgi:hypothetical protein